MAVKTAKKKSSARAATMDRAAPEFSLLRKIIREPHKLGACDFPVGDLWHGADGARLSKALSKEEAVSILYGSRMNPSNPNEGKPSHQGVNLGRKPQPFDFQTIAQLQVMNPWHSACIHTKTQATVGLGFVDEEAVDAVLDPLCKFSFQSVMNAVIEDFWQVGNGYMEIVRDEDDQTITGIHWIPAQEVGVVVEDWNYNQHFEIISSEGIGHVRFAEFGDLAYFRERLAGGIIPALGLGQNDPKRVSEVIHFARMSSLNRWYGFPTWLGGVVPSELSQAAHQQLFDFYANGGVPDVIFAVLGTKVNDNDWQQIKNTFKNTIGPTNQHKNLAINLHDPNVKLQVEKLALEGRTDGGFFSAQTDTLALEIVSAHQVPPLLAGIQIPGKLGANNELPNAILAFQAKVIGPAQKLIRTILANTLGNPLLNGGLPLDRNDFTFNRITEVMASPLATLRNTALSVGGGTQDTGDPDLQDPSVESSIDDSNTGGGPPPIRPPQPGANPLMSQQTSVGMRAMDTVARMREPLGLAAAQGRDLAAGTPKDGRPKNRLPGANGAVAAGKVSSSRAAPLPTEPSPAAAKPPRPAPKAPGAPAQGSGPPTNPGIEERSNGVFPERKGKPKRPGDNRDATS